MSKHARLVERINNINDFNDEQLKQTGRGIVAMVLSGELNLDQARLCMSLVLNEAQHRKMNASTKKSK